MCIFCLDNGVHFTQTFLLLAKDVDYYESLIGCVEIRERADQAGLSEDEPELSEAMKELVGDIIKGQLKRPVVEEEPESVDGNVKDTLAAIGQLSRMK